MVKKSKDYNIRLIKQSENDFPINIKMTHYKRVKEFIKQDVNDDILCEWIDMSSVDKTESAPKQLLCEETNIYEPCPPIDIYINDNWIRNSKVNEIIKNFRKRYNLREIESKFLVFDTHTGHIIVCDIAGNIKTKDRFNYFYTLMRKDIIIPMMSQEMFNVIRTYGTIEFYDLKGNYTASIDIKEKKYKEQHQYY